MSISLISPTPIVLVTGTTGLVGTAVALDIARAGFPLKGTSRSPQRAAAWSAKYPDIKIEWVIIPDHASKDAPVYDEAVKGCDAVVHVAGPYTLTHEKAEDIMIPQTQGVKQILDACSKEPKVRRLVYTSTVAAINDDPHLGTGLGKVYTEEDWNPTSWEKATSTTGQHMAVTSYCAGKTLAEKLVWEAVNSGEISFDVVVICPGTIYGQPMQVLGSLADLDAASARLWHHIQEANSTYPGDPSPVFSNVLDVAEAHLKALTWPKCKNQRYMVVSGSYSYRRIFALLRKNFPEHADLFPVFEDEGLPLNPSFVNDTSKAEKELGMRWRSLEETVVEAARVLFSLASV